MWLADLRSVGCRGVTGLALIALGVGCAKQAQVQSDALPVRKVVVYRNGVAYFERSGEVDEPTVQFRLRQENVGDFLATLAIMESGGHSVRAASFPVSLEEETEGEDPELRQALDSWERKKSDPRKLRDVTLELDGKTHNLTVGYLAETPLWRPSYRLVIGDKGQANLQVWGIVQNQSGEDWRDIELSLVAGAPIAFESTLGDPVTPRRPVVTDGGEVISDVPVGATSFHVEAAPPAPEASGVADDPDEERVEEGAYEREEYDMISSSGSGRSGPQKAASFAAPRPAAAKMKAADLAPRSIEGLAQIELQSGATRYQVPERLTVPDKSATMVLLVSQQVPGEAVHLFAPDPGVADSVHHPFRVVRFKNASGGQLEKGPIAVFEEGAFLGQGLMKSLPVKAEATVPFALVRDVAIDSSSRQDQRGVRFYAVRNGSLFVERAQATLTTYKIQNGGERAVKLLLRHERAYESALFEPPPGTEENLAEGVAYVPAEVPKFGKKEVLVEERRPLQTTVSWDSPEARTAIQEALAAAWTTSEQKKSLGQVLDLSLGLTEIRGQQTKLSREQQELEKSTRETRLSLAAIEKNPSAGELRQELTTRLRDGTRRLEALTEELVKLGLRQSEHEVRIQQAIRSLEIAPRDKK